MKTLKILTLTILILLITTTAYSARLLYPRFQAIDDNGDPLSGGFVCSFEVGTTTAKATFSDKSLTIANELCVELDGNGEEDIYLSGSYKLILENADRTQRWTLDDVDGTELTSTPTTVDPTYNFITNSGFGVWSNSGGPFKIAGVSVYISSSGTSLSMTSAPTDSGVSLGYHLTYDGTNLSNDKDAGNTVFEITAIAGNDITITPAFSGVTNPESGQTTLYLAMPGTIAADNLGPETWFKATNVDLYRETRSNNVYPGSYYSLRIDPGSATGNMTYWPQSISGNSEFIVQFENLEVNWSAWVKTDGTGTQLYISVDGTETLSTAHTGTGEYECLEATTTPGSNIVKHFRTGVTVTDTSTDDMWISQPMLTYGGNTGCNYADRLGETIPLEAFVLDATHATYDRGIIEVSSIEIDTTLKIGKGIGIYTLPGNSSRKNITLSVNKILGGISKYYVYTGTTITGNMLASGIVYWDSTTMGGVTLQAISGDTPIFVFKDIQGAGVTVFTENDQDIQNDGSWGTLIWVAPGNLGHQIALSATKTGVSTFWDVLGVIGSNWTLTEPN